MIISEEEFKRRIRRSLDSNRYGCIDVSCRECLAGHESCLRLPSDLRCNPAYDINDVPRDKLFQAYLDGKVVIVDREWCVVEED